MAILKDADIRFFQPLWRRVAVTVVCAAWSLFEFANGEAFWGVLTGGAAAYAAWTFLIIWDGGKKTE